MSSDLPLVGADFNGINMHGQIQAGRQRCDYPLGTRVLADDLGGCSCEGVLVEQYSTEHRVTIQLDFDTWLERA